MTKKEKEKFLKFKESLLQEISHSEECIKRNKGKSENTWFWTGAKIQAKEILNNFNEIFEMIIE
ncbi:hypothetical protein [Tepidibacter thalassicus]|uniref:Uncharacterized protein n=1 Tax=Tepidibacter thalassicus DSM 15285 TaxID=1123350 RepID=A0A1M5PYB5_9FIRM|nr:hypothetical protein [Tepidibacter thalassicus]SHH06449.1 hypothetical protein SAMN02744040_00660 [Tepidibacter thalassicus DSM 15285]